MDFIEDVKNIRKGNIYYTTDTSIFKTMPVGNRTTSNSYVDELIERIRRKPLKMVIMVNRNFEIIEGQHRVKAVTFLNEEYKESGKPLVEIGFVVCENYGPGECLEYNGKRRNWTNSNTLKSKCDLGDVNYIIYDEFTKKYNLPHKELLSVLSGKEYGKKISDSFKNGLFVVGDIDQAHREAQMITEIVETNMIPLGVKSQPLGVYSTALQKIIRHEKYKHEDMINKLKMTYESRKEPLPKMGDTTGPILELEEIFNKYKRESDRVEFISVADKNKYILKNARKLVS